MCARQKAPKACKIVSIGPQNQLFKLLNVPLSHLSPRNAPVYLLLAIGLFAPMPSTAQEQGQKPANSSQAPPNTAPSNPQPANPKPTGGSPGAGAPVDSNSYKIGPSDILYIRVWGEGEFSGPVAVHQDGKFTLPLVGDLEAGDKTPVEVQETIAAALKKLVVKPLVTVTVQEVGSKRYYIDGQANHPGEYALITPTTILEAISKAGGLADFANQKKIYVLRGTQRIPFNYKDVLKGKNMSQNIMLKPNDHIVVP